MSTYVVKKGDTLSGIAAKVLGSASKWKSLGYSGDPRKLQVGTKLTYGTTPAKTTTPVVKPPTTTTPPATTTPPVTTPPATTTPPVVPRITTPAQLPPATTQAAATPVTAPQANQPIASVPGTPAMTAAPALPAYQQAVAPGQSNITPSANVPAFQQSLMDPYTEAMKSAQLAYDTKARSIADYIKGQMAQSAQAVQDAAGQARQQAADQGLLSSTAAQKIVADYSGRAALPYQNNISSANTELSNLGNDLAAQAALNYQGLTRDYQNQATTAANNANAYNQWAYGAGENARQYDNALTRSDTQQGFQNQITAGQYNQAIQQYQDALRKGDTATALDIWKTLLSYGMGKGAVTGSAKDYTYYNPADATNAFYALQPTSTYAPVGDPVSKRFDMKSAGHAVFAPGTQTLAQKQMAQSAGQFEKQLALEAVKAGLKYDAATKSWTKPADDPYQMMTQLALSNIAYDANGNVTYKVPPATLLAAFKSNYGIDVESAATNGDERALALLQTVTPDWGSHIVKNIKTPDFFGLYQNRDTSPSSGMSLPNAQTSLPKFGELGWLSPSKATGMAPGSQGTDESTANWANIGDKWNSTSGIDPVTGKQQGWAHNWMDYFHGVGSSLGRQVGGWFK